MDKGEQLNRMQINTARLSTGLNMSSVAWGGHAGTTFFFFACVHECELVLELNKPHQIHMNGKCPDLRIQRASCPQPSFDNILMFLFISTH